MMNKLLLFVGLSVSALLFSCKPCVKCTHSSLPDTEICRENYDTQEQYEAAINVAEAFGGYDCK